MSSHRNESPPLQAKNNIANHVDTATPGMDTHPSSPRTEPELMDLAWHIEGQSVEIYWMRADLKWHSYPPHPEAVFLDEFLVAVDEDENCGFWG